MTLQPPSPEAFEFVSRAARAYATLSQLPLAAPGTALAGRFLYAGEMDVEGRALVVAANIAGAATLAATADREVQRQAIRQGIADFPVTSLDEALRILKNQLRKRETVSVCVALAPAAVEAEMQERGVTPDRMRGELHFDPAPVSCQKSENVDAPVPGNAPVLVSWRVDSAPAQWLPKLDAVALDCLDAGDWAAQRWLRFAPRYLGRMAQGLRLVEADSAFADRLIERVRESQNRGELPIEIEIQVHRNAANGESTNP